MSPPQDQPLSEPSDEELIRAWQGGDEGAAAALVRRHTQPLARFLAATGARQDLEDLVQETFLRAFRRIDGFRGEAGFATWLMAIGANALKDQMRRRGRSPFVVLDEDEEPEVPDVDQAPHERAQADDALTRLQAAVDQLPRLQREVFLMRCQTDQSFEAVAEALGTTAGSARVHYHQAVKRLKAELP